MNKSIEECIKGKEVVVTGASGFLGEYVCEQLEESGAFVIPLSKSDWDMTKGSPPVPVMRSLRNCHYVVHLAGYNGGIKFNTENPADIFSDNTLMGLNLFRACVDAQIPCKVLSVVASCAYPDVGCLEDLCLDYQDSLFSGILKEDKFLGAGLGPNQSVACHGYAKRNLQLASCYYRDQYELPAVTCCITTLYGPGDNFDENRTKVMGSLIAKFSEAKKHNDPQVECWGTGEPLREFIYAADAARDLVFALCFYNNSEFPLNCGIGTEISIKNLVEIIQKDVGYKGSVVWNTKKPNGQMRKKLDNTRFLELLSQKDEKIPVYISLEEGIKETIKWYKEEYE